jgi:hypothetical protein
MSQFRREDRYVVFKRKDFAGNLTPLDENKIYELAEHLPQRRYVVVESDWPEYEMVWKMIEARVTGAEAERVEPVMRVVPTMLGVFPVWFDGDWRKSVYRRGGEYGAGIPLFATPPAAAVSEPTPCTLCNALIVERNATHYDEQNLAAAQVRGKLIAQQLNVPAPAAQGVPAWINVADQMPGPGVTVLFGYRNSYCKWRTLRGHYSPLHTIEANDWDHGMPDETEDGSFEPEGWWEVPVESETQNYVTDEVTHWMSMPESPKETP